MINREKIIQSNFLNLANRGSVIKENKYLDPKHHIICIIRLKVEVYKSSLEEVLAAIQHDYNLPLSKNDQAFSEETYIKLCSDLWLQETKHFMKTQIDSKNQDIVKMIFNLLRNIYNLNEVPSPLNTLPFYKLLKQHQGLVRNVNEGHLIYEFKKECLGQIISFNNTAQKEIKFLEAFVDFLTTFKDLKLIIVPLQLKQFCDRNFPLDKLIENILKIKINASDDKLTLLKEAAGCLKNEKDLFMIDKFKDIIGAFIKPVEIQERKIESRYVIEIIGKIIVVSEILIQLERKIIENPSIEEVRFVGGEIIHIDADLNNNVMHGKNIVIFTKKVRIHSKVTWNVSGKNNDHVYSTNAGIGKGINGKQGSHGYAGESGGNVSALIAEEIFNPEYLTIISNGGKGSNGQDGGDGQNGQDGKGIKKIDFAKKFPSVIKALMGQTDRRVLVQDTIDNIECLAETKRKCEIDYKPANLFYKKLINNVFLEVLTKNGAEISFSFCSASFFSSNYQAFLIYKGSLGEPGGNGGEYGLGGQGGLGGEININKTNIVISANHGEQGKNGKGGLYRKTGKNGWDMGYTDYQYWRETSFHGSNENTKLELRYYNDDRDGYRIWCPYYGKYAEMIGSRIEHVTERQYEEKRNIGCNTERQHQRQASGKKSISNNTLTADYKHHTESSVMNNLKSDMENSTNQALEAFNENQDQQETENIHVTRHVNFTNKSKNNYHYNDTKKIQFIPTKSIEINVDIIISELNKNFTALDNWLLLKSVELNSSQIKQLFDKFIYLKSSLESSQSDTIKNQLETIEQFLTEKLRFSILQEIAKKLPFHYNAKNTSKLPTENPTSYLVETRDHKSVSHKILGTINQYLYENSIDNGKRIIDFCKNELQNENKEAFKCSIKSFVLEAGLFENAHTKILRYFDDYKEFSQNKKCNLDIKLNEFKMEISQPCHKALHYLWIESSTNDSVKIKFEEEIKKNTILDDLYNSLNDNQILEYDWNKCCKDKDILKQFNENILENGPISSSYRELLSYIFNISIWLYVEDEDEDNQMGLYDTHNNSVEQIEYVFYKNKQFIQLSIDEARFRLDEDRKMKDNLFAQILVATESLTQYNELNDYFSRKAFFPDINEINYKSPSNTCEEQVILNIAEYFSLEERQQIKQRLEKIISKYIGHNGILHNILRRFLNEGKQVSSKVIICLVNSILTSIIEDKNELCTFCWIVAAYPQKNWLDELILLQLENYFKKPIENLYKWREYLSKIKNKDILFILNDKLDTYRLNRTISTKCIDEILFLLSNISNEIFDLEDLGLSEWPYALKEKYWSYKLKLLVSWKEIEKLETATYYLLSLENTAGTTLVEDFYNILKETKLTEDILIKILLHFYNGDWDITKTALKSLLDTRSDSNMVKWMNSMMKKSTTDEKERNITELVELIEGNANTSKEISDKLCVIKEAINSTNYKGIKIDTKKWLADIKKRLVTNQDNEGKIKHFSEMLSIIDTAIQSVREFKLRDTQKLAILALLTNKRNTLAQVSTGEGKSLIVVAVSIIKAICGEKVDIITSSSVLAKRDAEDNKDIYNMFDVSVLHNCSEDVEKRKEAYSSNQIIYGDLSNFQRDYLLDTFHGKKILGDRNFQNIIVDEVDSMLLDKGNTVLYLSHDMASLSKIESVYIYIWQWINRPAMSDEDLFNVFSTKAIKDAVLNDLYSFIKKEDLKKMDNKLSKEQINSIWERLLKAEILDDQGKLLIENVNINTLRDVLSPDLSCYEEDISYLLTECIRREKYIHIPNYVKPFIKQHLEAWINSAITAFFMKIDEDYVVDVDRTGTSQDRNPNITILDRDTGTDQANSQWDEALHQFLQLKHGCRLSLQSLKAVFISNVSYFKLYSNLYGLTGTLGSHRERDLVKEIHEIDFVTIPTAKSKQFQEKIPVICSDKEQWINQICNETKMFTNKEKRSVLIICQTMDDVTTLHEAFGGNDAENVYTYKRDYEEFKIAKGNKQLNTGQIIIATNLAGRGTDIKITEELRKAGGLHVCLAYLPDNSRIEQQAFGRAARCGNKGSGQLIFLGPTNQKYSNLKIIDLKKERDAEELHRVSGIKTYYDTQITTEEKCLKMFKIVYEKLKCKLDFALRDREIKEEIVKASIDAFNYFRANLQDLTDKEILKEILLRSCLDMWAFWLDENSAQIKDITNEAHKKNVDNSIETFILQLMSLECKNIEDLSAWVNRNPVQMIKLGKFLSTNKLYENSIKLFNQIIEQEPHFSEAAHYFKAFAVAKKINFESMRSYLDMWAIWIYENSAHIINEAYKKDVQDFIMQIILKCNNIEDVNRNFSEAAHDLKSFAAQLKSNNLDNQALKEFKSELQIAKKLFDEHKRSSINAAGIIGYIKENNNKSIIQIDSYEEQQKNLCNLYSMFSRSVDDIFGHPVTSESFINNDIKEELADVIFKDLLRHGILKNPKVKSEICEEELKIISSGYGVPVEKLKDFLSKYKYIYNEKHFQKSFKKEVLLPSKESFWKFLIEGGVLTDEVKYVIVNKEKLTAADPSFSDDIVENLAKNKLMKQILEPDNNQILLHIEQNIKPDEVNDYIFIKKDFIKYVGIEKYQTLKNDGVLSINKKAAIDSSKIDLLTFSVYDFITPDDLIKENISKDKAKKILLILVEQNVLTEDKLEKNTYRLKVDSSKIKHIQLIACPIYEEALKALLNICFSYRIALQNLKKQVEDKSFPICLQLISQPHQSLTWELLDQKIIKPVRVKQSKDVEDTLKKIYNNQMTKNDFINMLSQANLVPDDKVEELFNHLIVKDWITKNNLTKCIREQDILGAGYEVLGMQLYSISDFCDKKYIPLSSTYTSIEKTLKMIFDNRLQLTKKETIENIAKTLERLNSILKSVNTPDPKLNPLTEFCDQGECINEMYIFVINGLDQIIRFEEMKWSRKMLFNTAVVVAIGTAQITIGTLIELYSVGVMTHVGGAFVSDGVNDIFFAVGALKSGYFSWKDYRQQKLQSVIMSAATAGIGAYIARGAKVSRFGYKIGGPNLKIEGQLMANMAGDKLIGTVGINVISKEVVKRIAFKAIQGAAFALASAGVDMLVENHLQKLCESIASKILSDIDNEVEGHSVCRNLEEAYTKLGDNKTREIVNNLNKGDLSETNYIAIASKIVSSVTQGIIAASRKMSKTGNQLELPLNTINQVVVWSQRTELLYDMLKITSNLLDSLSNEIKSELEKEANRSSAHKNHVAEKDYESFKIEIINQLKSMLHTKVGHIISHQVVSPILKQNANHLLCYLGNQVQRAYTSYKESGYFEEFRKLKEHFEKELLNARNEQKPKTSSTVSQSTNKYHTDLLKLLEKTNNPALFASIVRENIPMDLTCVSACTLVINKILNARGLQGVTITVKGEGGITQEFGGAQGEVNLQIELLLENNHFQLNENLYGNVLFENIDNNCLFEALSQHVDLNMSAKQLRDTIAEYIEQDPEIQYNIKQGWHKFPLSLGAFGGKSNNNILKENKLNEDAEKLFPFKKLGTQTSPGTYEFDPAKDVDLREVRELSHKELHSQRVAAYWIALETLNKELSILDSNHIPLKPTDFEATMYDGILCTKAFGKPGIIAYPVEIKANVTINFEGRVVEMSVKIDMDIPVLGSNGPQGPHIGFKTVRPNNSVPRLTGHVYLNPVGNENSPTRGEYKWNDDQSKIPVRWLFYPPIRGNTVLKRTDETNDNHINLKDVRGYKFPSPQF